MVDLPTRRTLRRAARRIRNATDHHHHNQRTTTTMTDTIVISIPDGTDYESIVERARIGDAVDPTGFIVISDVKRSSLSTLEGLVNEIRTYWRGKPVMLVGIDYHFQTLWQLSEVFDVTLAVAPDQEHWIDRIDQHLPGLLRNCGQLGPLGSARVAPIPLGDNSPESEAITGAMRSNRGEPLHELADVDFPQFYAYRAPGPFANPAEHVLNDMGRVIDRQATSDGTLQVTGFVFDVEAEDIADRIATHLATANGDPEERATNNHQDPTPAAGTTDGLVYRDVGDDGDG